MENKTTIYNATQRWLNEGYIKPEKRLKMQELNVGDWFIKENRLCRVIDKKRASYIEWEDVTLKRNFTNYTHQVVDKIRWCVQ